MKTNNNIRYFLLVIFIRNKLILLTTLLITASATISLLFIPPVYTAEGSLIVKSKDVPVRPESSSGPASSVTALLPETEDVLLETRLIASLSLIRMSVEQLINEGIDFDNKSALPEYFLLKHVSVRIPWVTQDSLKTIDYIVEKANRRFKAVIFPGTNIIDVSIKWEDPEIACILLGRIISNYHGFRIALFTSESTHSFYRNQSEHYRDEMERHQKQTLDIIRNNGVSNANSELEALISMLNQLTLEHEKLKSDYIRGQNRLDYLKKMIAIYDSAAQGKSVHTPMPSDYDNSGGTSAAISQNLHKTYLEMRKYSPGSPQYVEQSSIILSELGNMISYEEKSLGSLSDLLMQKDRQIAGIRKKTLKLRELQTELDRLSTDADLSRKMYVNFSAKLEEIKMELGSEIPQLANIQVLAMPLKPLEPDFPKPVAVIPAGFLTGLFLSIVFAFIVEYFDHTFKTPEQIDEILGLKLIGSIPAKGKHPV